MRHPEGALKKDPFPCKTMMLKKLTRPATNLEAKCLHGMRKEKYKPLKRGYMITRHAKN